MKRTHKLTAEQRTEIRRAYADGARTADLATQYGVTVQYVHRLAMDARIRRGKGCSIPPATKAEATAAFIAGEGTIEEIASRFGMSIWTLQKAIKAK